MALDFLPVFWYLCELPLHTFSSHEMDLQLATWFYHKRHLRLCNQCNMFDINSSTADNFIQLCRFPSESRVQCSWTCPAYFFYSCIYNCQECSGASGVSILVYSVSGDSDGLHTLPASHKHYLMNLIWCVVTRSLRLSQWTWYCEFHWSNFAAKGSKHSFDCIICCITCTCGEWGCSIWDCICWL